MNTLLRSLIVWLLLLAVPCQGMAAAAMLACAPAQSLPAAVPAHAMHQMGEEELPPCHQAAAAAADSGERQHQGAHGGAAKCASCAACGLFSAILPTSFPALASHAPPGATGAPVESWLPSVHLAQPERPPRPRLA